MHITNHHNSHQYIPEIHSFHAIATTPVSTEISRRCRYIYTKFTQHHSVHPATTHCAPNPVQSQKNNKNKDEKGNKEKCNNKTREKQKEKEKKRKEVYAKTPPACLPACLPTASFSPTWTGVRRPFFPHTPETLKVGIMP
jgi:hypothetical protein